jgi:hypothetical protein
MVCKVLLFQNVCKFNINIPYLYLIEIVYPIPIPLKTDIFLVMKKLNLLLMSAFILIVGLLGSLPAAAQASFRDHFTSAALRIDYHLLGSADATLLVIEQMKKEPQWGGPRQALVDPFGYGEYRLEVWDRTESELLHSQGFSTLYHEWQTTAEARYTSRAFYQSIRMPFPRKPVHVKFLVRKRGPEFVPLHAVNIDPDDYFIINEPPAAFPVHKIWYSGDPATHVDLVFLAEGYQDNEMEGFLQDVGRMADSLFLVAPFNEMKDRFNIWAVASPSMESGTDIPGERIYRNTIMNFSYYTFDLPRYLTSTDVRRIRDVAAAVPYDHIAVLINTDRYGGGGIYQSYTAATSDHPLSLTVLIHELGHGFAGLGDEYYNSEVAYEGFYALDTEPWEPNLTTLKDFESKWKHLVAEGTPIPTPNTYKYRNTVGVFEGGGYVSKGIYRPALDCRMKSNEAPEFCGACQEAIRKMIEYYSGL